MRRCVGRWRGLVGVRCRKIGGLAVLLLVLDMTAADCRLVVVDMAAADCRLVSARSYTLVTLSVLARSSALATRIQIRLLMEWRIQIPVIRNSPVTPLSPPFVNARCCVDKLNEGEGLE